MSKFYMQDSRGNTGSRMMWWSKDGKGYTTNLDECEVYDLESAQSKHNCRETDIPWRKDYIDSKAITSVDMQYLDSIVALPAFLESNDSYIQIKGEYNGNDILFSEVDAGCTYNLLSAAVVDRKKEGGSYMHWPKAYIDSIARRVSCINSVNRGASTRGSGLKLKRSRRRPTMGKTRLSCETCGRFVWSYNPYEDASECVNCP